MAEVLPVLFRAERSGQFKGDITAVFPTQPANHGNVVIYAHVGQHGEGSLGWYASSRPATPEEYAGLLKELKGIYENEMFPGDEVYELQVRQKMTATK